MYPINNFGTTTPDRYAIATKSHAQSWHCIVQIDAFQGCGVALIINAVTDGLAMMRTGSSVIF